MLIMFLLLVISSHEKGAFNFQRIDAYFQAANDPKPLFGNNRCADCSREPQHRTRENLETASAESDEAFKINEKCTSYPICEICYHTH